jgi:hypothetical protein
MTRVEIETDYLVIGAGALGMGFVDTLIEHSDAEIVIIDRRHGPGGHWLDSYPFVQLHQPSMNYGVNSTPLGQSRVELDGRDAGFYERATGPEICGYYDEIMRHRFLASGRVRFFPMCDYLGDRRFRSRLTGAETEVTIRKSVVDATYMASRVPATDAPPFEVSVGATCVPIGALTSVVTPPHGYVIIGAGKTAMDAVCWLLDNGTPPDDIRWIRPRDPWMLNRAFFQPGEGLLTTFAGIVVELEAVAESESIGHLFDRLAERQVMLRLDPTIQPSTIKGATVSLGELDRLRSIGNVIRVGHVTRIDSESITLERGSAPTSPDHLHVHCASAGLSDNPPRPIFIDDTILLQPITRVSLSLSAGLIGLVEASGRSTAEKNRLCPPNMWFDTPFDWIRHLLTGMRTELEWREAPDVMEWVDSSRLNLMKGLDQRPDKSAVADLQSRFLTALFPALARFETLTANASPAERARMFESVPWSPG